ncbi:MAG TPA: electron transfer flavoprotein-ubiquinone oxidoreductase [Pyrinomonadaceae bacterium]|nr:electron transfer flavoprotein-ubiquinone oxidoreductase [Pyrinomonadaceae bacterium]HMP66718.1 electron transfer flavoprotein-ubiquinone oxidoreductase [Pyrinomonadaceae bacterium]
MGIHFDSGAEPAEQDKKMIEREQIEMDVVFVGAGPANLAGALHLKNEIAHHDELIDQGIKKGRKIGEVEIAVVEKGSFVGAHILSGAVMDPIAIRELMPDFLEQGCPVDTVVTEDAAWYLTENRMVNAPIVPPPLKNKGKYIISLSRMCEWLAEKCEEAGINVFPEFPASEVLYDSENRVIGIRTGDKGIDKDGHRKPNFEPGVDLLAKVTVLGEGSRGSLTKQLMQRLNLMDGKEPQVFSIGVKELWELPEGNFPEGKVVHTLGSPSDSQTYGGGWIYGMKNNVVSIGYVTGLDYVDPLIDPHSEFQKFKTHPAISEILKGGKMIKYGAKSINAGGYWTMPKLFADGVLLVGDSASFLNGQRIKGIHTGMKSGMLAAEAIVGALEHQDYSENTLRHYEEKVNLSWIYDELYPVRNFHGAFQKGRWSGLINSGLQFITRGLAWGFMPKEHHIAGHERMARLKGARNEEAMGPSDHLRSDRYRGLAFDKELTFDKVTNVFHAGVAHDEDQPSHLRVLDPEICATRCAEEYGNPCQRFCPAAVYEMEDNAATGRKELKVNFSNCVHCKTCDIADPYQIINWVTPEGGGGPNYKGM